jgi:hypothetical protein
VGEGWGEGDKNSKGEVLCFGLSPFVFGRRSFIFFGNLYGLGFDHYQKYPLEIQKVSEEDVHRVAREYFKLEAYALAMIRPPTEKKE